MKCLIVSTYPPLKCGIGKYAFQMANKLQKSGDIINVLSPADANGDFLSNLRGGFNLLKLLKYSIFYDKVVLQYHQSFYYDDNSSRNYPSILATHISFYIIFILLNSKIEIILHEVPYALTSKSNYRLERLKWRLCPKLVFHTAREIENFELHYFKLSSNKLELRAPEKYYYKFRDVDQKAARDELGISKEKLVFLCIGFIQPHKGFDRAIKAFAKANNKKMELYVVGSLRIELGTIVSYLHDLKEMAAKMSNVHILEKYLSDEEFDTWISASDIVIIPYREIWSSGIIARTKLFDKHVIASDIGGLFEQLTDKDILFQDDSELEQIISEISNNISEFIH